MIRTLFTLGFTAFTLTALPTYAAGLPEVVVVQQKVRLGDLDLSRPADARQAIARLDRAARNGCGYVGASTFELSTSPAFNRCRTKAVDSAVAQINLPMVTVALTEIRTGSVASTASR